jgi:hypothetical protein
MSTDGWARLSTDAFSVAFFAYLFAMLASFHYLAFREIEDGWALAKAGLDWDASLGYPDAAGFRLGVCHPIPLFDPVARRPLGILACSDRSRRLPGCASSSTVSNPPSRKSCSKPLIVWRTRSRADISAI